MKSWNNAEKTLAGSFFVFLVALFFRVNLPESTIAELLLFVSEAALVGGVADWFAVTALFEKPLGFPWHTAILPRRRREFTEAMKKLIRREFFSRKNVIARTRGFDIKGMLLSLVKGSGIGETLTKSLTDAAGGVIQSFDRKKKAAELSAAIRHEVLSIPFSDVMERLSSYLAEAGRDRMLLGAAALYIRDGVESDEAHEYLVDVFEQFQRKKLNGMGAMIGFLASLAAAMDVVNFDELASGAQREAARLLSEAADEDSALQSGILVAFHRSLVERAGDETAAQTFSEIRSRLLRELPLEEVIEYGLGSVASSFSRDLPATLDEADDGDVIGELVENEVKRFMELLEKDERIGRVTDSLVQDVAVRSALKAQAMSEVVAEEVLSTMTDERLSAIVYSKTERDLLWIRMNGSIVGSLIGLIIFAMMKIAGL